MYQATAVACDLQTPHSLDCTVNPCKSAAAGNDFNTAQYVTKDARMTIYPSMAPMPAQLERSIGFMEACPGNQKRHSNREP
jgi:hypothetical protein